MSGTFIKCLYCYPSFCSSSENKYHFLKRCLKLSL
jgi:hypothetical protein